MRIYTPVRFQTDFEDMKDKICYRVINAKLNQNIDAPYIPISDDLMMTFFIHYQFNKDIFEIVPLICIVSISSFLISHGDGLSDE